VQVLMGWACSICLAGVFDFFKMTTMKQTHVASLPLLLLLLRRKCRC
jgi:hypothetical protein